MSSNLFVYGTLKKGKSNHQVLKYGDAQFIQNDSVDGQLWFLGHTSFPYLTLGNGEVKGEVYKINKALLLSLDRLEGHPHHYLRTKTTTKLGIPVNVYILAPNTWPWEHTEELISSGEF